MLIVLYDMHYGKPGRHDAEAPLIRRGETFEPIATSQASATEVARFLTAAHVAMTPDDWQLRKPILDTNAAWAASEVVRLNTTKRQR